MESSHRIFCGFAPESGSITESGDGFAPATLPAAPSTFALCGYTNSPQIDRGLNNSLGFSIGSPYAVYRKRGSRNPTLSITLKGFGAISLLDYANRQTNGELPSLCFTVGVPGVWTEQFRFAKINTLSISANESPQGEATEIEATVQVEAIAVVPLASPLNPNLTSLQNNLGAPLFWHDVRSFSLTNGSGTTFDMRRMISSFSAEISHNLERKNERNDFGDNQPLSNTNYKLLEHNVNVSGEISLHERISESLFTSTVRAQNWGNIAVVLGDLEGTQLIELTFYETFPQTYSSEGVEAGAQLSRTVPFMAHSYDLIPTPGLGD